MSSTETPETMPFFSGVFRTMKLTGFCRIAATKNAMMNGSSSQNAYFRKRYASPKMMPT